MVNSRDQYEARTFDARQERVVERRTWVPATIGPGMVLGILGAVGVVISMFVPWQSGSVYASDIPVAFLFDHTTTSSSPSLLILLIPLVVVIAVGALLPMSAAARALGGLGTLAVTGVFAFQLYQLVDDAGAGREFGNALDTGFYIAAIGGLIALVSGFLPAGWTARRTVERDLDLDRPV